MIKTIIIAYFPKGIKFTTPVLFGVGVYLGVTGHWIWAVAFVLLCIIILTTRYVTAIDIERKVYYDFTWFLGLQMSKEQKRFHTLHQIVVTKTNHSQNVNTRSQSRVMKWSSFTGTLLMDNDQTLDLLTRNEKSELVHELRAYAQFLNVPIEDRTSAEPYWIH